MQRRLLVKQRFYFTYRACIIGRWRLPDYREIALSGERMYVNGDRVEMDAVALARFCSFQYSF